MTGNDLLVSLGTDATGALSSTAAQVVTAINANAAARALLQASTYRGNAGAGVVAARPKVNLSDFLDPAVAHGPFEYQVMRIGKRRDGSRTGVFLYCEQHAREWATPLTCLETAERLLRNYAIDKATRDFVDNLDIFILPVSNPDGSHYAFHNFSQQRRNMTNHCAFGWKETDDPNAANFNLPRQNPGTGALYTNTDPASRNAWGVDLNRNNTFGTIFDGYIGASYSCTSDTFAGPAEASEPEIKNELWIADTFKNIKFSNNIHSFGGYFMWAPGAYLPDRGEGDRSAREHRHREVLLRGRRQDPQPDQGAARHRDPAGAHRPDRRRALLGRRQQRRRALVPPRHDRVQLRDGRGPVRQHGAERRGRGRARPGSGPRTGPASRRATRSRSTPASQRDAHRRLDRQPEPGLAGPERHAHGSR